MKKTHIWIIHQKRDPANRSRETGWSPVAREYTEESATKTANLILSKRKTAQIKISKHKVVNGKTGENAKWDQEPVSETLIGRFSRTPKPKKELPKEKKPVITKGMTAEERVHARRMFNMTEVAKPHARRATDRKRGK